MTLRHFLALEMTFFLAGSSAWGGARVWGVVVQADRASLDNGSISTGATVYDGDHFSVARGGILCLRGDAIMLELAEDSAMIVRSKANGTHGAEAELTEGTLVFSTVGAAALEIASRDAQIRPAGDTRTLAQVSVAGPKELRIHARRGSLQFSYRGDTATIAEGAAYRVILDQPEDDPTNKPAVKPARQRKSFRMIAIAAGAAGAAVVTYELFHHHKRVESPDRP
jgi:hypothetical protein